MKHLFMLTLLFSVILNALPIVDINSDTTNLKDFQLEYFVDKTKSMPLETVKQQQFTQDTSTLSLGIFQDIAWIRFKLHNTTQNIQKLYIHNENAYIANGIDFYEFFNSKLINSLSILMEDTKTQSKMFGSDAIFMLTLDINQTKTIYIKSTMKAMQYPFLTIYNEKNSKKRVSKNNSLLFIILGMLIALSIYHILLYLTTKYKEYIYYGLYLASAAIWESILSGMLANGFDIYMNTRNEYILLSILFLPIFLVLFTKSIFDTEQYYKTEDKFLNSVLILFVINIIIGLFNIHIALVITSQLFTYMFIVLLSSTFSIMRKGNPLALTFLLANTLFSLMMMVTNLYYQGYINYTPFTFNAASIGIVIEAIILSFLLAYRIKILQKSEIEKSHALLVEVEKSREKDKIMFQQQKLVSMGEMIENIAHQWRQPLSQINSSVLVIDNLLDIESKNYLAIDKKLIEIENLTLYMSKTIDNFKNFLDPNKQETNFSIQEVIGSSLLISKNSITDKKIVIEFDTNRNDNYYGLEDELQQVLIILLNNAREVLIDKNIKNPVITIRTSTSQNDNYSIMICDNGGGISEDIIDKIFEPYFTTKHKSQGTGLGLYISKLIIEENMMGSITVSNMNEGACFKIELPNKESCDI
ncbi:MAG: sensor histidine kinase [Campylobacterota bacterium]|nr:sensor histidine kinase [Campylobacterota bacterium]